MDHKGYDDRVAPEFIDWGYCVKIDTRSDRVAAARRILILLIASSFRCGNSKEWAFFTQA